MAEASKSTTDMYLNVPTTIKVTMSASRTSGSTVVHFSGTLSETQDYNVAVNYNAIYGAINGYTGWIRLKEYGMITSGSANFSFDVDVGNYSSGSRTFEAIFAVFNNAESGTVGGIVPLQINVGWGDSASAPTGLSVSIAERYTDGAKFNVSITGYGSPNNVDGRWIEAGIAGQNAWTSPSLRSAIVKNTTSSAITVSNNSTKTTSLTVQSNTRYWYGGYATNTVLSVSAIAGQFYTLPAKPVGSNFQSTGTGTATFNVKDASQGSGQTIQLQYQIKKHSDSTWGSWTNAGSTGNKQTRTVNLTGLESGTAYDIRVRAKAGSSDYSDVNTYSNAFTTDQVSITITGHSCSYSDRNPSTPAVTVFDYIISAVGSASDTYDIRLTMTNATTEESDSFTFSGTSSGSYTISLPSSTQYTVTAKARPTGQTTWGTASTYTFTTPSFVPGAPIISNVKWASKTDATDGTTIYRYGISADLTAVTPGEGEQFAKMRYEIEWYDEALGRWVGASAIETTNTSENLYFDNYQREPRLYPKVAINAWQENDIGNVSSPTRVVFTNRPLAAGVMIPQSGSKEYVVAIKTKDTAGNLNSGNYEHPLIIK